MIYVTLSINLSNIKNKFRECLAGMLRLEPRAAGWEAGTLPQCFTTSLVFKSLLQKDRSRSDTESMIGQQFPKPGSFQSSILERLKNRPQGNSGTLRSLEMISTIMAFLKFFSFSDMALVFTKKCQGQLCDRKLQKIKSKSKSFIEATSWHKK